MKNCKGNASLGKCYIYVHINLQWYHIHPGLILAWFHSKSNQFLLSGPVSFVHLGLLAWWHLGMLALQRHTELGFQGIWVHVSRPCFLETIFFASGVWGILVYSCL